MLHDNDVEYFDKLKTLGFKVAKLSGIDVKVIEPKRRAGGTTGLAYLEEKRICIEVRNRDLMRDGAEWSKGRYKHSSNLHTVAHELAHLKEHQAHGVTNHGERFKAYEQEILKLMYEYDCK